MSSAGVLIRADIVTATAPASAKVSCADSRSASNENAASWASESAGGQRVTETLVSNEEWDFVQRLLTDPPKPTAALVEAMRRANR